MITTTVSSRLRWVSPNCVYTGEQVFVQQQWCSSLFLWTEQPFFKLHYPVLGFHCLKLSFHFSPSHSSLPSFLPAVRSTSAHSSSHSHQHPSVYTLYLPVSTHQLSDCLDVHCQTLQTLVFKSMLDSCSLFWKFQFALFTCRHSLSCAFEFLRKRHLLVTDLQTDYKDVRTIHSYMCPSGIQAERANYTFTKFFWSKTSEAGFTADNWIDQGLGFAANPI